MFIHVIMQKFLSRKSLPDESNITVTRSQGGREARVGIIHFTGVYPTSGINVNDDGLFFRQLLEQLSSGEKIGVVADFRGLSGGDEAIEKADALLKAAGRPYAIAVSAGCSLAQATGNVFFTSLEDAIKFVESKSGKAVQ